MRHQGTKRLETERLILRRFAEVDAESVFKNWASDPEVTKFLRWKSHTEADYYYWAIEEKGSDSGAVGYIGVFWSDETVDSVEVGYSLGRRWQGRGYMSEALMAVIDFLIDEAGANRVVAAHDPRNAASGGVMKRCGMKYEGTMRQVDRNNQGICDLSFYAVLASDRRDS